MYMQSEFHQLYSQWSVNISGTMRHLTRILEYCKTERSTSLLIGFGIAYVTYYLTSVVKKPVVACKHGGVFQRFLTKHCTTLNKKFWPTIWCFESRCQTVLATIIKSSPHVSYRREAITLPDGGEVVLDWIDNNDDSANYPDSDTRPTVLFLPGLTGGSEENYMTQLVEIVQNYGYRAVVFNYRGINGGRLLTPRTYCACNTEDLQCVVSHIKTKYPRIPLMGAGISLGGMILFHYFVKFGKDSELIAGMSVSTAWNVFESTKTLEQPMNWLLFNRLLASRLANTFQKHMHVFENHFEKNHVNSILRSRSIREFDAHFTSRVFGYESVDHYYEDCCLHDKVHHVHRPFLCLNSGDDPFSPMYALPLEAASQNDHVAIVATSHGGHIGFLDGLWPRKNSFMNRLFSQYVHAVFEHGTEELGNLITNQDDLSNKVNFEI